MLRPGKQKLRPSGRAKVAIPQKTVDPFYVSTEWRGLCEQIKRERWPRLRRMQGHCCEDPECTAQHRPDARIFFDHIQERRDAPHLELVKSNIMGRCGSSHSRVTAERRRRRYMGGEGQIFGG